MRKLLILLLFIPIVVVSVEAINDYNPNYKTLEDYLALSSEEQVISAARINYDGIENFKFQFTNTIRGWFGKSYDDYNRYYMSEEGAKKRWFILGKYFPYFFLFIILFLLKYELQKDKGSHTYR